MLIFHLFSCIVLISSLWITCVQEPSLQEQLMLTIWDSKNNIIYPDGGLTAVKNLLKKGADINGINTQAETPLCAAIHAQNIPLIKLLIELKADLNLGNPAPIVLATYPFTDRGGNLTTSNIIMKELIKAGAQVNNATKEATYSDLAGAVPVSSIIAGGNTALMNACSEGNNNMVESLLDAGANVNAANDKGETPLMLAAARFEQDLEKVTIIKTLLKYGANRNATNNKQETAAIILSNSQTHNAALRRIGKTASRYAEEARDLLENGVSVASKAVTKVKTTVNTGIQKVKTGVQKVKAAF